MGPPVALNQEAVPPGKLKIIPGLPDKNSTKVYRIQIGAYTGANSANWALTRLKNAGFNAQYEQSGGYYKVFIMGISAQDAPAAASKLGALGFSEIWIRE